MALLGGDRRYRAMADWGRCDGQKLGRAVGFPRAQSPCAATLDQVLRQRDSPLVAAPLSAGAERVRTALPPAPGEPEALAIAGNTLRGRRTPGAAAAQRLAVRRHRLGLPLWPQAVAEKTTAMPVLADVFQGLVVEGRGITVEALLTHRAIAPRLVAGGGDSGMVVKGHHPPRHHDIPRRFQEVDTVAEPRAAAATGAVGPGRIEQRRWPPRAAVVGDSDWPGLAPVFQRERRVPMKASEAQRADVVDGVTRLSPEQACPEPLLGVVRQHGPIENHGHGVREVTFDADRAQVRSGRIPQVRAAFRTTTLGVMPWVGETKIAAACRRFAAQPGAA